MGLSPNRGLNGFDFWTNHLIYWILSIFQGSLYKISLSARPLGPTCVWPSHMHIYGNSHAHTWITQHTGIFRWDGSYAHGKYTHMRQNIMTVLNITMNDMILMHNPRSAQEVGLVGPANLFQTAKIGYLCCTNNALPLILNFSCPWHNHPALL